VVLLAALCALVFVVSLVVQLTVFPLFSGNKDEPVYALQAELLRDGHVTFPAGDQVEQEFFQPWFTGVRDDHFYYLFPPGWPAALAAGELIGSQRLTVALAAALCIVGTYALAFEAAGRQRRTALVATGLLAISPILPIQAGLRVSYLVTLALGLLFGAGLLRGARTSRPILVVGAGAALGGVFITRPFDAGLWLAPFVIGVVALYRKDLRRVLAIAGWGALGAAPFVLATFAYNAHVTGDWSLFPITAAEPLNKFGFGARRLMPTSPITEYGKSEALEAAGDNFAVFPIWAVGSYIGIALALAGVWLRRRAGTTWILVGVCAAFPIGYLYYWGLSLMAAGAAGIGPQYYIPLYAVIAIFAAVSLVALWERWKVATAIVTAAAAAISGVYLADKISDNRGFTDSYESVDDLVAERQLSNALLFVPHGTDPHLLTEFPFFSNNADLDGSVLYAVDLETRDLELVTRYPDRNAYRLVTRIVEGDTLFDRTTFVEELSVARSRRYKVSLELTNPDGAPAVVAYLYDGETLHERTLDLDSAQGERSRATWVVGASDRQLGPRGVTLPEGSGSFAVGFRAGLVPDLDPEASISYEVRFGVENDGTILTVLEPGEPWTQAVFNGEPVWLLGDPEGAIRPLP
jgi:hypothetical protein